MSKFHQAFALLIIGLFFFPIDAISQRTTTYDSILVISDKTYLAKFQFYTEGKDTIFHGPFELSQQFESQQDEYEFSSLSGHFERTVPVKNWELRQGTFVPTGEGFYKDYTFSYKVNGTEFLALGGFEKGNRSTEWEIYDLKIKNSKISDTTLYVKMPFRFNKALGEFEMQMENDFFEGRIGEKEFTEGTWSYYRIDANGGKSLVKQWVFEEHLLTKKILYKNGETFVLDLSQNPGDIGKLVNVKLDEKYLNILDLKAFINNPQLLGEYREEQKISDLFEKLINNFEKIDDKSFAVTGVALTPNVNTKLMEFPFSDKEEALMSDIVSSYAFADSLVNSLVDDTQINIASISTEKVAWYKAAIISIREKFLEPVNEMILLYENQSLKYLNRQRLINKKIDFTEAVDFTYLFEKDTIQDQYKFESDYSFLENNGPSLKTLNLYFESLNKELLSLRNSLYEYIDIYQKEERLVQLESAMMEQYESLKNLNDSIISAQHNDLAGLDVRVAINDFAEKELSKYSNLPSVEEKMGAVEPLIECFSKAHELVFAVQNTPENTYTIRGAYTKQVFNPYTFTEMEEKIKPAIFKAFNEQLLPGIFENLQKLNCNNLEAYTRNFEILYEGMIDLLKQDTKRQERRVRKSNDAPKAASALNLNLKF